MLAETRRCAGAGSGHAVAVRGADPCEPAARSAPTARVSAPTTSGRRAPCARTPSSGSSAREAERKAPSGLTRSPCQPSTACPLGNALRNGRRSLPPGRRQVARRFSRRVRQDERRSHRWCWRLRARSHLASWSPWTRTILWPLIIPASRGDQNTVTGSHTCPDPHRVQDLVIETCGLAARMACELGHSARGGGRRRRLELPPSPIALQRLKRSTRRSDRAAQTRAGLVKQRDLRAERTQRARALRSRGEIHIAQRRGLRVASGERVVGVAERTQGAVEVCRLAELGGALLQHRQPRRKRAQQAGEPVEGEVRRCRGDLALVDPATQTSPDRSQSPPGPRVRAAAAARPPQPARHAQTPSRSRTSSQRWGSQTPAGARAMRLRQEGAPDRADSATSRGR
jgi:hypothetical protein